MARHGHRDLQDSEGTRARAPPSGGSSDHTLKGSRVGFSKIHHPDRFPLWAVLREQREDADRWGRLELHSRGASTAPESAGVGGHEGHESRGPRGRTTSTAW